MMNITYQLKSERTLELFNINHLVPIDEVCTGSKLFGKAECLQKEDLSESF